ncbi:MAG: hypothetical protein J6J53_00070 [Muribaculaceae bacterium]|nr:hypothetical protein [Muribaculaceae bacterium]
MEELTNLFDELLRSHGSVDVAESEFKRLMADDSELHDIYRQWCDEHGHTERHGFLDYAEEYIANQNSVWDSLRDDYEN